MKTIPSPIKLLHRVLTLPALAVGLTLTAVSSASATDEFTATGSMREARYHHTAALLPNGKVLVAGGRTVGIGVRSSAELYDPTTGKWSMTGPMLTARVLDSRASTLLPNGKVIVVGGSNNYGADTSNPELYDPSTGKWTKSGAVPNALGGTTFRTVLLQDSKLLAIWVVPNPLRTKAALYDFTSNTWTATGAMLATVYSPTLTLLTSGKVLAAGGSVTGSISSPNAEIYDPTTGLWTKTGSLDSGRFYHASILLPDGKVLTAGGAQDTSTSLSTSEIYDPEIGAWTPAATLPQELTFSNAVSLSNGRILFSCFYDEVDWLILYNPVTGLFQHSQADSITPRHINTMTLLPNGKVLIAGGTKNGDFGNPYRETSLVSAELYSPRSPATLNVWVGGLGSTQAANGKHISINTDNSNRPIVVGGTATRDVFLQNTGTTPLILGPIRIDGPLPVDYTASTLSSNNLAPGESTTFTVTFKPIGLHLQNYPSGATVHIDSNDADQPVFDILFGAWVRVREPEIIVWNPKGNRLKDNVSTFSFGKAKMNHRVTQKFTIGNEGGIPLKKLAIRINGKNAKDFKVSGPLKTELSTDGQTKFKVTFKPTAKGKRTATLLIRNNDADENPFDIKIEGIGAKP